MFLQKYGPTFFGGTGLATALARFHAIKDHLATDEELTEAVRGAEEYPVQVATYTGDFVLQKLVAQFADDDAAPSVDDARVLTIHLAKVSGGSIVDTWSGTDFDATRNAFSSFWLAIAGLFNTRVRLDHYKYYRAGPSIVPPNPASYQLDITVPGTGGTAGLPPQCAITVTEMAGAKPHWGRFYLPSPSAGTVSVNGRIATTAMTTIADAADTMYQAFKTAGCPAVVYRMPLPARKKKSGVDLPAREASAWTVEKIQVDDVFDVIRSRRRKYPNLRLQRDIT
jgi:hypothetical protein